MLSIMMTLFSLSSLCRRSNQKVHVTQRFMEYHAITDFSKGPFADN